MTDATDRRQMFRENALALLSQAIRGASFDAADLIASATTAAEVATVERELRDLVQLLDAQRAAASLRVSLLTSLY